MTERVMKREYREYCKRIDPGYKPYLYPCRGRLFETWRAAWIAALEYAYKGESK